MPLRTSLHRLRPFLEELFALRDARATIAPSLQAGIISSVTVVVSCLLFGPELGAISLLGSMLALWESKRPLWARVRNGLLIAATMSLSMTLGVLVAPYRWATIPVIVVLILAAAVAYYGFLLTRGPGPLLLFYGAVLGTYFGADPGLAWKIVGITAFAALFTCVLTLVVLVADPHRPEQRAIADARRAVEDYRAGVAGESGTDTFSGAERSRRILASAYGAVNRAWLALNSAHPGTKGRGHRDRQNQLLAINRDLADSVLKHSGIPGRIRQLTPDTPLLLGRPGFPFLLTHALRRDSVAWFTAWRIALAAGLAGLASELAGIGHSYWAILTAALVLHQWTGRVATTRRAVHRAIGTFVGLFVVALVIVLDPGPWWVVGIIIVCLIGQDVLVPFNYFLALILVTPMTLLAIEATGQGGSPLVLLVDRLLGTLIGGVIALAITWATSTRFPARLLRAQYTRVEAAIAAVERSIADGTANTAAGRNARVELSYELTHHYGVADRASAEEPGLAFLEEHGESVIDKGYVALAKTWL
ncbi:FUSC family protein [Arthrobacter sp. MA-N2]|uniref:FUSC family protein n=1 Tax=Arthrobacter sp. MA-N2 TaxID=1101188 RepID=UPI000483A313|nr:FUSC family protein [Arthrobacter sp. MA-N2]